MRFRSNYFEIQDLIIQFANAFDSVVIGRYNKNRQEKDRIFVRYVYAPKQRVIYDIVNKAKTITLPVVAITINSISRDNTRVFNKLPDVNSFWYLSAGNKKVSNKYNAPVPVNINVNFSVITRYQLDMDQILSNFIPYSNPYIIISWPVPPGLTNLTKAQEIRSEVLWDGGVNVQYPTELKSSNKARIVADTSFTIKGWIFPKASNNLNNINTIYGNFYTVDTTSEPLLDLDLQELLELRSLMSQIIVTPDDL